MTEETRIDGKRIVLDTINFHYKFDSNDMSFKTFQDDVPTDGNEFTFTYKPRRWFLPACEFVGEIGEMNVTESDDYTVCEIDYKTSEWNFTHPIGIVARFLRWIYYKINKDELV